MEGDGRTRLYALRGARVARKKIVFCAFFFVFAFYLAPFVFQPADPFIHNAAAALATDCTLFASVTGNNNNSGTSPSSPKTFDGAGNAAQPGDVVCVMGGTYNRSGSFYPPRSGTPNAWIVYKAYGDSAVNFIYTGSASNWTAFFRTPDNPSFPSDPAYLEFNGFTLDGRDNAVDGFFCRGGHHWRIRNNIMKNFGAAGIATVNCDYITAENNLIHHAGYGEGWASGITLNSNRWFDTYAGFHNIVANNIISASYDNSPNHTDGNGIILDLGGNTPPALVINNVVFGNGGRCIQALKNQNFWFVNNTCYKNGLDTVDVFGGVVAQDASNGYIINNISYAWNGRPPYDQLGTNTNIKYFDNMYFGAANRNVSNSEIFQADPLFINPPVFHPTNAGQYATALAPWLLGNGLSLLPASPALGKGIDPSSLPNVHAAIVTDLKKYIYADINGAQRTQGVSFDLGAYQVSAAASLPPPAGDTVPPSISIITPSAGTTVSGTISILASASDNVGVAGVEFKLDGNNLGAEDMTAPYSASWNTAAVANGNHTLTAVARDSAGNQTTSAGVSVSVNNALITPSPGPTCANPSPHPNGFAIPCPILSISASAVNRFAGSLTITSTPPSGQTAYIWTTIYISNNGVWVPHTLSGSSPYPGWATTQATLTLSGASLSALTTGIHYIAAWDWTWNGSCYLGPGSATCNQGSWRVQTFNMN